MPIPKPKPKPKPKAYYKGKGKGGYYSKGKFFCVSFPRIKWRVQTPILTFVLLPQAKVKVKERVLITKGKVATIPKVREATIPREVATIPREAVTIPREEVIIRREVCSPWDMVAT